MLVYAQSAKPVTVYVCLVSMSICSKYHQVRVKTKKIMEEGGGLKRLGLDRVKGKQNVKF